MVNNVFASIRSADVAIDFIYKLQIQAIAFYDSACRRVDDSGLKNLFASLLKEKRLRLKTIEALVGSISGWSLDDNDLVGEYGLFVKMLSEEIGRLLVLETAPASNDYLDAARTFESKTADILTDLKPLFRDSYRTDFEAICLDAQNHLQKLSDYHDNS